ncbi:MAG: hypothetical protein ACXWKP_02750 [Bradyrhizobium sp.]
MTSIIVLVVARARSIGAGDLLVTDKAVMSFHVGRSWWLPLLA